MGERVDALLAAKACAPLLAGRGFSSLRLSLWHGAARLVRWCLVLWHCWPELL